MSEIELRELDYKLNAVREFMVTSGGLQYKVYNHCYPDNNEPDSNIVEYFDDIIYLINKLKEELEIYQLFDF